MLLARQELQGEDLLQLATVELDRRGPVESIQRDAVLKASLHQVAFEGLVVAALVSMASRMSPLVARCKWFGIDFVQHRRGTRWSRGIKPVGVAILA